MTIWTAFEVFVTLVCSSPLLHTQATLHPAHGPLLGSATIAARNNAEVTDIASSTEGQNRLNHSRGRDFDELIALNANISEAETSGDKHFLDGVIAPALAFGRADTTVVDRAGFLANVKQSAKRTIETESISFFGSQRALVTCVVTTDVNGVEKRFHNLRLFIRAPDGSWKVLAWANEGIS